MEKAAQYGRDVLTGKIITGKLTKLAVQRHDKDLKTGPDRGLFFCEDSARRALTLFSFLKHSKGEWAGQTLELEPWQAWIIACVFGWKNQDTDKRRFRTVYEEIARKNGKALAVDTPIPTPTGWACMGELSVGDKVFDEKGKICHVTFATQVMLNHKCYEVTFSDGSKIIADAEHIWKTESKRTGRIRGKKFIETDYLHTTEYIYKTLKVNNQFGSLKDKVEWNHKIPISESLKLPEIDLPIDPYVLGAWLGDGETWGSRLTSHIDDYEIRDYIKSKGISVDEVKSSSKSPNTRNYQLGKTRGHTTSLRGKLRALGVFGNKHIPGIYLRAGTQQRTELLRGLMDTDGYCSKAGQCEFTTVKYQIAVQVKELLCSLGYKPGIDIDNATLNGKDCGLKYRIQFWSYSDNPCFNLSRKKYRLKPRPVNNTRAQYRQIVSVEPVESFPVRCIQVDSESHLFLAGHSMIATHNTTKLAGIGLYGLTKDNEGGPEVYAAATKREQSRILFDEAARMIKQSRPLRRRLDEQQHRINNPSNFGKFEPLSADGQTMDGLNPHFALVDELHAHKTAEVWDVLKSALGARSQPLIWAITTAGFNKNSICYEVRDYAIKVLSGIVDDDSFFSCIYTLDDGDQWQDESNWIKANPNLGVSVSLEYLREQARQAAVMPTAKINFFTKHLNIWVTGATAWCNVEHWQTCAVDYLPDEILEPVEVYLGLDLASVSDIASIGGVAIMPDGRWLTFGKHYLPEDAIDNNIRKSTVPFRQWHEQGWLTLTPGNVIDYNWIKADILSFMERFPVKEIAFDRWNSSQLVNDLMEVDAPMVAFGMGYASMNAPMKELERRYLAKEIQHPNDPVLNWAMSNVVADQDPAGNVKPAKNKSTEKIDPAVALMMAIGRAMVAPESQISVGCEFW
ncbi:MAG: terminase TerL endonuclease subunit [Methylobacter sp.]